MKIFAAALVASLMAAVTAASAGNVQIIQGKPAQGGRTAVKNKPFDPGGLYLVSLDCHPYALDPDNRNNFFTSLIQNRTRQLLFTLTISTDPIGTNEVPPAASVLVAVPVVADTLSSVAPVTTKNGTCSQSFLATGRTALYLTSLYTDQINTKPSQLVTFVEALASTVAPLATLFPKGPAALITTDTTVANSMAQPYANLVGAISWQSSETDTASIEEGSYRINTPVGYVSISVNKLSSLQDALKIPDIQKALDNAWQTAGAALETGLTSDPVACHTAGRKLETNGNFSHADAVDALAHIIVDDPAITSSQATACLGTDYGPEVADNSYFKANARDVHLGPGFTNIVSHVPYNSLVFKGIASSMTVYAGGNANAKTTLDGSFELSVKIIDTALGMFDGSPTGAARDVVGIRRGAISGNMKVSFQAARSIG